jgi:hypothetical protein
MLERETAAADASLEPVAQALEPRDPVVELVPPALGEPPPVGNARHPVRR